MTSNTVSRPRAGRATLARALTGVALAIVPACDFLDPTRVENPQTTTQDLANAKEPTAALIPGVRAQFARALGAVVVTSETVSDNYSIHATGLSKEVDDPYLIIPSVGMINGTGLTGAYWNLQELRALADFVLNDIAAQDAKAKPAQVAEAHFYRGMAFLMQAENFVAVPVAPDSDPVPASELLNRAVQDFQQALTRGAADDVAIQTRAALARAYRLQGNAALAQQAATAALAARGNFAITQRYDVSQLQNAPFIFLIARPGQEMQPLPRLDFLDPKYLSADAAIPFAKAEEMHLIVAEAAMAGGNFAAGRQALAEAVALANSRPTVGFVDNDPRKNADLTLRPRDAVITVRADATQPFQSGLVQGNGLAQAAQGKNIRGAVVVPIISGTSLTRDQVLSIPTSNPEALIRALYLARQEIFFLEGRRMSDLGIRLPIAQREIDSSPRIEENSPGTSVQVPNYIPRSGEMDLFSPASPYVDQKTGKELATSQVTILHDVNRILARNFGQVSPFRR